ncbi:hypothetical protein GJ744_009753 [Endocarpon pusillum]|uniref:Uncharacterized protein n=1 Tax=Endocarpon pusillum TaxID=364733 RepID=A0A8H7AS63_9EURO|nr:hypothetical protein GJ744_009753 [Endocarpon pusillum]
MTTDDNAMGLGTSQIETVTGSENRKSAHLETPLIVALPVTSQTEQHTLGQSLRRYIKNKISIASPLRPSRVIVRPYGPGEKPRLLANNKIDKRPYLRYIESTRTLEVLCIPGKDLVKHYALLIATYYGLDQSEDKRLTQYSLPRKHQCYRWLHASNLRELGPVETVVLYNVERLGRPSSNPLKFDSKIDDPTRELFDWQIHRPTNTGIGSRKGPVAILDCNFKFWGDIAASLVEVLHDLCEVRQVLYIGKAGSLRDDDEPNTIIATGNDSWIDGAQIIWNNILQHAEDLSPKIQTGSNASVYSPLEETHEWLFTWCERCHWVDCEVGNLALACIKFEISFGYLNIISDNVAKGHEHDLTNEQLEIVKEKRQELLTVIESVLNHHLGLPPDDKKDGNGMP